MEFHQLGIWVADIEKMRTFYENYLEGKAGSKYTAGNGAFFSYTLSFPNEQSLELMHAPGLKSCNNESVGGEAAVKLAVSSASKLKDLVAKISEAGYAVRQGPSQNPEGNYESIILDAESNTVKLTA